MEAFFSELLMYCNIYGFYYKENCASTSKNSHVLFASRCFPHMQKSEKQNLLICLIHKIRKYFASFWHYKNTTNENGRRKTHPPHIVLMTLVGVAVAVAIVAIFAFVKHQHRPTKIAAKSCNNQLYVDYFLKANTRISSNAIVFCCALQIRPIGTRSSDQKVFEAWKICLELCCRNISSKHHICK